MNFKNNYITTAAAAAAATTTTTTTTTYYYYYYYYGTKLEHLPFKQHRRLKNEQNNTRYIK